MNEDSLNKLDLDYFFEFFPLNKAGKIFTEG